MNRAGPEAGSTEIGKWLVRLGFEQYRDLFAEHAIDMAALSDLTEADLAAMGMPLGHRKKLLRAIAAEPRPQPMRSSSPTTSEERTERRQLTIMICDIADSTRLAQRLDPEDLRSIITTCLNACIQAVASFGGHVARLVGDGLNAYFGYPLALEDAAERAVRAALAAAQSVSALDLVPGVRLNIRAGVATGLVVVGDLLGEGSASEEFVFGETPAMAARLQALATPGSVVIAPATRRLLGDTFELEFLGPQKLKGIEGETPTWRVLGERRTETRFDAMHRADAAEFVGRDDELALLWSRWQSAVAGEGQVVLLSGEPGIGKSRICRRLHERIRSAPHAAVRLQCSPYHTNSALYPIIANLERAAGLQSEQTATTRRQQLGALLAQTNSNIDDALPVLSALLSIPADAQHPAPDFSARELKQRTLEVLCDWLLAQCRLAPVLFLLEDVHWVDPTTLELIALCIDRLDRAAILVLITCRPEFEQNWTSRRYVTALNVNRLGRQQTADLVGRVAGDKALPPEVLDHIIAKTDGVPLFIEELTRTILESGVLEDRATQSQPLPQFAIPTTLQDSLLARLDRLTPIKEVAQVAAAIGREFSHELIDIVAPLHGEELEDALRQLVGAGLIHARGAAPSAIYTFKHALVRDAAYSTLLLSRRSILHARIADALRDRFPAIAEGQPELVAHHLTAAGLAEQAVEWWRRAGERAVYRSGNAEAIAHLSQARELLATLPPERRIGVELDVEALLGQATMEMRGYSAPETMAVWQRARSLLRPEVYSPHTFPIFYGLWASAYVLGEVELQQQVASEALARATALGDSAGLCVANRNLGTTLVIKGEFAKGREYLERARALYDPKLHRSLMFKFGQDIGATAMSHLSLVRYHLGLIDQALAMAEAARRHAAALNHPHTIAYTDCHTVFFLDACRADHGGHPVGPDLVEHCERHGFRFWGAIARMGQGWASIRGGDVDAGMAGFAAALQIIRQIGTRTWLPMYLALYAQGWARAGEPGRALSTIDEAIAVARATGQVYLLAELLRLRSNVLSEPHLEAWEGLLESVAIARRQGALCFELRAAVDLSRLAVGRTERDTALAALRGAYGKFTEGFATNELVTARSVLAELGAQ